ncbi:hypothetical protein HMI54_007522 [Coelomomyces lativittatus]|nr:hypothetical protein HMI54_007522 [Coelomomyces lativittatus]KAJ1511600.1 hypothetical protein HMI56_005183 [Coelomomyces lativittatus]
MMSADLMDSPFLLVSRGTDPTTANPNITTSISINNGTSTSSASSSSSSSTTSPTTHTTATSTTTTSSSPSFPLYSSTPLQPTHPHSLLTALTPTSTNTLTPPTPSLGLPNTFTSLPLQTQVELLNKYRATDFFEGLPTLFEAVKGSFQETLNKEHAVLAMENNQIVLGQGNTGKQAPNWLVIEELELVKLLLQESIVSRTDPKWELICNAMSALRHRRLFTITVCNKARIRIIRRYLECKRVLINEFQRGNLQFTLLGQCVEKVIRLNESAKINPTSSSSSSATSSPTSSSSSLSNSNSHSSNIHKTNGLPTAKRLRTHSFSSSNSPPSLLSSPPPPPSTFPPTLHLPYPSFTSSLLSTLPTTLSLPSSSSSTTSLSSSSAHPTSSGSSFPLDLLVSTCSRLENFMNTFAASMSHVLSTPPPPPSSLQPLMHHPLSSSTSLSNPTTSTSASLPNGSTPPPHFHEFSWLQTVLEMQDAKLNELSEKLESKLNTILDLLQKPT